MPWSDQPEPPAGILYTYAFLPTPGASLCQFIQQTPGIQQPLQVFSPPGGRIAAAIEPLPDPAALQASDEVLLRSALRHDEVLCRLFAQTPLLPLRFGTCFLSAEKLGAHLLTQQAEYEQALAVLGKRAEYCLKGRVHTPLPGDPPPAPSGTAYLLARKQAYLQQRQAQEQQQQELAVLQQLWPPNWPVQRGDPQSGEVLRLYFLLTPAEREVAAQLTQTWLAEHPHWQLDWSPPLPPYHFVDVLRDLSR
jgi:hypothetical protein